MMSFESLNLRLGTLFGECGKRRMLADLAKIDPENRHEEFRRLCVQHDIRLRFAEDLEIKYKDEKGKPYQRELLVVVE